MLNTCFPCMIIIRYYAMNPIEKKDYQFIKLVGQSYTGMESY